TTTNQPPIALKYLVLAPWVVKSTYDCVTSNANDLDLGLMLILPFLLLRALNNQFWISLSRYKTAKGKNRIVDKTIEFEQVDRERDWDDQILFNGILYYVAGAKHLPLWRLDGVIIVALLHAGVSPPPSFPLQPVSFSSSFLNRDGAHH
ncbi:hypothetical protein M8C21_024884, partial [Ambrosia artemisiifolia]